ncbi:CD3073 family putative ECF transporter S component [Wansuia hejianensis]|uniref:ECF transporter S component n=1 Tax=Wansuia hejianensis TaxID=2763667 RepID=A0A926EYS3_9FIRM|nr:CD3073 family putative ECF transporter S component [Wansuia hejianensis]MBC8590012.1 ECF transporter S component [Wansuia hejianensis]
MNKTNKTYILIFSGLAIAVNLVLGTVVKMIGIPLLFLDTVGTIFTAAVFGPLYGAMTGGLTNVIQGVISGPKIIPFAFVNIAVGLVVGFVAKRWKFNFSTAIITGLILAIVAPLIGTPIATYVYGGITGDFNDVIFTWLVQSGQKIFTAAFIPRVTSNLVDKIASCLIVSFLIQRLPSKYFKGVKHGQI